MKKKRETLGKNTAKVLPAEAKETHPNLAVPLADIVEKLVEKRLREGVAVWGTENLKPDVIRASPPPTPAPGIPTALNEQNSLLESLASAVDALALRLDSVLSKSADKPAASVEPSATSHVLSRLYEHNGRIARIDNRIRELLETLLL